MSVPVVCPNPECGTTVSIVPEHLGQTVHCEQCGLPFEAIGETCAGNAGAGPDPAEIEPQAPAPFDLPSPFGRYEILRKLGQGGMGTVYLARDPRLGRLVALKVPNSPSDSGPGRFHREAQAAAGFHHPNFCPIYDFDQIDGTHYLAMAFIDGETLASRVDRDHPMPAREAAEIVRNLALALAEAHRLGIIHRDLKPANVMIDRRGTLIIMDFGLARRIEADDLDLTRTGVALGTPAYMSPEQAMGSKDLGPATDIYALGVILYQLSTGRRPFEGSPLAILGAVQYVEPEPPSTHRPDLDQEFEAICLTAMAKKIQDRYASMEALATALGDYLDRPAPVDPTPRLDEGTSQAALPSPSTEPEKLQPTAREAAEVYLNSGNAWHAKREFDKALADYDQAIQKDPKYAFAYVNRGNAWYGKKEFDKALADYDQAIRIDPRSAEAHISRGTAWYAKRDLDKALADYDQAIRIDPRSANAYSIRGLVWIVKGKIDKALADYSEVIRIEPKSAAAYSIRAGLWRDKGKLDKALADYDQAVRIDPRSTEAYYYLAWNLATSPHRNYRDGQRAVELSTKACELTSWKVGHHIDALAAAHAEAGDFDAAVRREEEAIALAENYHKKSYQSRLELYRKRKPYRQ